MILDLGEATNVISPGTKLGHSTGTKLGHSNGKGKNNFMSLSNSQSAGTGMDVIRIETALSRYPIHRLASKGIVDIDIHRKDAKGATTMSWSVDYGNRHGQPGPLAYKLDTLVINRKIDEAGRPTPRVLALGSLHEIAMELGLDRNTTAVRKALLQNVGAIINAKITYKAVDKTERTLEAVFSRYSVVFTGEQLPDGHKADCVYLILNEPYAEVIDAAPRRPQDYEYLKDLPPAPQRFYEIISYQMLPAIKYSQRAKLPYSEFCLYSTITRYFEFERVKKQMYKIHLPHVRAGYLAKIEYETTVDADGRPDWDMLYHPGETARHQQHVFEFGTASQRSGRNKPTAKTPQSPPEKSDNAKPDSVEAEKVVHLAPQTFSVDADFAEFPLITLIPAPSAISAKRESSPQGWAKSGSRNDRGSERNTEQSEAGKLVREFYQLRYGRTQDPTDREITEARQFLAEGNGWAQHLVAFAAHQGKDKNSFPNDFGGVKKLVSQAREPFDVRHRTSAQVKGREARQSHEKAHGDAYCVFLGSLLGEGAESSLSEAFIAFTKSEAFTAFTKQEQETFRFHQGRSEKSIISARLVKNFYLLETRISRLAKFIQENPQSGLPSFWQWDKTLNPTPLGVTQLA